MNELQRNLAFAAQELLYAEQVAAAAVPMLGSKFVIAGTLDDILRLIKLQVVDDAQ